VCINACRRAPARGRLLSRRRQAFAPQVHDGHYPARPRRARRASFGRSSRSGRRLASGWAAALARRRVEPIGNRRPTTTRRARSDLSCSHHRFDRRIQRWTSEMILPRCAPSGRSPFNAPGLGRGLPRRPRCPICLIFTRLKRRLRLLSWAAARAPEAELSMAPVHRHYLHQHHDYCCFYYYYYCCCCCCCCCCCFASGAQQSAASSNIGRLSQQPSNTIAGTLVTVREPRQRPPTMTTS
jgi:hypothetical protein